MRTENMTVLEIAEKELGKCEQPKGSNWGTDIQKYLSAVHINFPAPWCMAFVQWCLKEADIKDLPVTAGVIDFLHKVDKSRMFTLPKKGDIFILDFGHGLGHTGFVTDVLYTRYTTIEGNSNEEGSREGYEVCRKPGGRLISSARCFIRI